MVQINNEKGIVFNIQKYSIHDGSGIRTLVFMKGCPLRCRWCSNPESQTFSEEIMFIKNKCIGCGKCVEVCPQKATDARTFEIDRNMCTACGNCAEVCYANAKKNVGTGYSVGEIMEVIEKDRVFYRKSQGGVTIGGGEPTAQPQFVLNLLKECKRLNIHTAIETCGYGEWKKVKEIFETVDQILYDLKHMDDQEHLKLTGVSNHLILRNAEKIARMGKAILFRIPVIPGYNSNDENIIEAGKFIKRLMNFNEQIQVELLPYHNLGADKYSSLGRTYQLDDLKPPETEKKEYWNNILESCGCNVVR